MTEDEAVKRIRELGADGDREMAHWKADELIAGFLRERGYLALANAYNDECGGWWYA